MTRYDIRHLPSGVFIAHRLPRIAEAGMVLLIAWAVAGWLTTGGAWTPTTPRMGSYAGITVPLSVKDIAAMPLFGKMVKEAVAVKSSPPRAVVVSRLRLQLLGTILAGIHSAAIITLADNNKQKLVFSGDQIQSGVVLKRVEAMSILVDNHGRLERIPMGKSALAIKVPVASKSNAIIRHMSRAVVEANLNDLPTLLTQARAIPHQMGGKPDGFLIQEIVPDSLYAQAGLKNGDVIRKVNGQPIMQPEQVIKLFQSLRNANSIDLEFARNGVIRTVHFDIR